MQNSEVTPRKTRDNLPLRPISASRLQLLTGTPKSTRRIESATPQKSTNKLLRFENDENDAGSSNNELANLLEQFKSQIDAAIRQLLKVQETTVEAMNAAGRNIEAMDLAPHLSIIHEYAFADQSCKPQSLIQEACEFYEKRLSPLFSETKSNFLVPFHRWLKMLASLLFLAGYHYKGLRVLNDLLCHFPSDMEILINVQKWCVMLAEWEILEKVQNSEMARLFTENQDYNSFVSVCKAITAFNLDLASRDESMTFLYEYVEMHKDEKTFINYELQTLIHFALSHAYKLPAKSRNIVIKDGIYHLETMTRNSEVILKNMVKSLLPERYEYSSPLFEFEKQDSSKILKTSLRIAEHIFFTTIYVPEMFKHGQTRDAATQCLRIWITTVLLGMHINIVRATWQMFSIKFSSQVDKECRKNMRAITTTLLSCKIPPPASIERNIAENTIGVVTDIFSELCNSLSEASDSDLHAYTAGCTCSTCTCGRFDAIFRMEWCLFVFAFREYPVELIPQLPEEFTVLRSSVAVDQKKLLGRALKPRPPLYMNLAWTGTILNFFRSRDFDAAQLSNSEELRTLFQLTKKVCTYLSVALVVDHYILRLCERMRPHRLTYSWMNLSTKSRFAKRAPVAQVKPLTDGDLHAKDLRKEFKFFKHILVRDWRMPICTLLAKYSADLYESALMIAETMLLGTRQVARAINQPLGVEFDSVAEFKDAIQQLPDDITVVQLSLADDGDVVLMKLHRDRAPIIVPLAHKEKFHEYTEELQHILAENETTGSLAKVTNDSKYFWKERRRVDDLMQKFIKRVEKDFLGPFAVLMRPSVTLGAQGRKTAQLIKELSLNKKTGVSLASHFCAELTATFVTGSHVDFETQWQPLAEAFAEMCGLSAADIAKLSQSNDMFNVQLHASTRDSTIANPRYTLLVVCPELSSIPWEQMPIFEKYPYVGRVGSIPLLLQLLRKSESALPCPINPKKGSFVCDPDNNLGETQKRMMEHLKKFNWEGICGKIPVQDELQSFLSNYDFYVYLGHGSGSRYFSRTAIRKSECRAVSFLMGCSSVAIQPEGRGLDGKSSIYDYYIAGCPCIMGCLWMVTDGEIDRYFIDISDYLFDAAQKKPTSRHTQLRLLMDAMAFARGRCKLRYLTGAAVVTYGLPVVSTPDLHSLFDNLSLNSGGRQR